MGVRLRVLGSIMGKVRTEEGSVGDGADNGMGRSMAGAAGPWQQMPAWPAALGGAAARGVRGDSPPPCQSRVVRVALAGNHGEDGSVRIRQDLPLPLYVVSMEYDIEQ